MIQVLKLMLGINPVLLYGGGGGGRRERRTEPAAGEARYAPQLGLSDSQEVG